MIRLLHIGLLSLALTSVPCIASAQLTDIDTAALQIRGALQGSLLTGNVERFVLMPSLDVAFSQERWGAKTSNTYQYGTFGSRKTEDDIISRNFFYLFPKSSLYPYLMIWLERNFRRGIDFRYQSGVGASYVAVQHVSHRLKLSLTITKEETLFKTDQRIATARLTARILGKHFLFDDAIRLRYELWIQPSLNDHRNARSHADGVLELPLSKHFSLLASFNLTRESVTLPTVRENDALLLFGLSLLY